MVHLADGNLDGWFSRDAGKWTFENGASSVDGRHLFSEGH